MAAPGQILAGGGCGDSDCPAIMTAGNGMVDIQGYHQADARTPDGEIIVRIPAALIMEAARVLAGGLARRC
jgi:hypothetical protein